MHGTYLKIITLTSDIMLNKIQEKFTYCLPVYRKNTIKATDEHPDGREAQSKAGKGPELLRPFRWPPPSKSMYPPTQKLSDPHMIEIGRLPHTGLTNC